MNTREGITKITRLPSNNNASSIRVLYVNDEQPKRPSVRPRRPAKNEHLMMFDDDSQSSRSSSPNLSFIAKMDAAHITSSALEAYGGKIPSNGDIERRFEKIWAKQSPTTRDSSSSSFEELQYTNMPFKCFSGQRFNHQSLRKIWEDGSIEGNTFNPSNSKTKKKKRAERLFPKNILMRSLLTNQMASMSLESSSNSTSGKDDSDIQSNSPDFVEMPDDPDVLLRPEMMDKGVLEGRPIDDGFRFAHHGIKKTITPRRYLMDHIDDDDLVFRREVTRTPSECSDRLEPFEFSMNCSFC